MCSHMEKIAQGLKAKVLKKRLFCLQNLGFYFFQIFLAQGYACCHLRCDRSYMNMKDLIFSKKIHEFHCIRIFSDDSIEKINYTSFIPTNLKLRFEACVFNLV
jgi:hypothetical protein